MSTAWTSRYAQRTKGMRSSAIRELLKFTQRPEVISFAGGLPASEVFPTERFREACCRVLERQPHLALQYGATEGYEPLREMIARHIARYGIKAKSENVLITSGSQQALDLIGKLLLNPGDRVLVEAPTYLGALQAFSVYGAEYVSVPSDEDGLRSDLLEAPLRSGPKFMYVLPNFQNPGGTTLSEGRRHELVLLADKYGIPIVEDDPYGQLRYEGEHLTPLVVLDRENLRRDSGYSIGNVIYLSTFSKTLAPGLRLGWIVAPPEVISKLVQLKQGADLHSSTFVQMVAYEVARDNFLDEHVKLIRRVYRERRDVMLEALAQHFPAEVTWTRPKGGLFLWVTLPEGADAQKLFEAAVREKCGVCSGGLLLRPERASAGATAAHAAEFLVRTAGANPRRHPAVECRGQETTGRTSFAAGGREVERPVERGLAGDGSLALTPNPRCFQMDVPATDSAG
jgi:2-aminoadipate transaminase